MLANMAFDSRSRSTSRESGWLERIASATGRAAAGAGRDRRVTRKV